MTEKLHLQRDDIIELLEIHFIHNDFFGSETVQTVAKDIILELKKIADVLRPFYACVHNDNGDVSISQGNLTVHHWLALDKLCSQLERIE